MTIISVIIPTKDRLDDLSACLRGLADKSSLSLLSEVIIIDDHSKVPYRAEIERLAAELKLPLIYDTNKRGHGSASARNQGSTYARGDILALLDDDAIPEPGWLHVIATNMDSSDVTALTGRILPLDGDRLFSRSRQLRYELRQRNALARNCWVQFLAGGNGAIRTDQFKMLGGFNEQFVMMNDGDLAQRLVESGKQVRYVHELVIRHRHFKTARLAIQNSFKSAYYRHQFEIAHPQVSPWSVKGQFRSFATLVRAARQDHRQILPASLAIALEFVHSCGCVWYRNTNTAPGQQQHESRKEKGKAGPWDV